MAIKPKNDKPVQNEAPADPKFVNPAGAEQAPVLPAVFEPYISNPEYEEPYSPTLVQKSNDLARKIWGSQEAYFAAKGYTPLDEQDRSAATTVNSKVYQRHHVDSLLYDMFRIPDVGFAGPAHSLVSYDELLKKLKKLEKQHDIYDILDEDGRQRIIDIILLPVSQFGLEKNYFNDERVSLQYPPQPSVVNGLLTDNDLLSIQEIVNFLPRVRRTLMSYKPYSNGYTVESLLQPIIEVGKSGFGYGTQPRLNPELDRSLLTQMQDLLQFFSRHIPHMVVQDHIPELRYPTRAHNQQMQLGLASKKLRDISADFLQEAATLSELLEAIVELSKHLASFFVTQSGEIELYFTYLNRIGVKFETMVTESKVRIGDGDVPW